MSEQVRGSELVARAGPAPDGHTKRTANVTSDKISFSPVPDNPYLYPPRRCQRAQPRHAALSWQVEVFTGNGPARTVVRKSLVKSRPTVFTASARLQLVKRPASTESAPISPPTPPPKQHWSRFLQITGGFTLVTVGTLGVLFYLAKKEKTPGAQLPHDPEKKTLVVLGSGWGATSLLKSLDTTDYNVIVISPKNYFLFTPLLPSVAVGTLNPRSIIQPTRYVTRHKARQVSVIEASATEVDPINKTVTFAARYAVNRVNRDDTLGRAVAASATAEFLTCRRDPCFQPAPLYCSQFIMDFL
ncbi:predicted protein [Postia placenta Mad-698-R]|nr:predicted protein [Postia placenta Mad-698-R]